jgi:uncharacterized Zn finger protein (UPF0148 family)
MGRAPAYEPHHPEYSLLYSVIAEQLETFLARQAERHCDACGKNRLLPFSCKGRGFCPSCTGRRKVETPAHLATLRMNEW